MSLHYPQSHLKGVFIIWLEFVHTQTKVPNRKKQWFLEPKKRREGWWGVWRYKSNTIMVKILFYKTMKNKNIEIENK